MSLQLNEEYFERLRGEQSELRNSIGGLQPQYIYCDYCRRKTSVLYKPDTAFGHSMVIQLKCPKCKRELLTKVSYRLSSTRVVGW